MWRLRRGVAQLSLGQLERRLHHAHNSSHRTTCASLYLADLIQSRRKHHARRCCRLTPTRGTAHELDGCNFRSASTRRFPVIEHTANRRASTAAQHLWRLYLSINTQQCLLNLRDTNPRKDLARTEQGKNTRSRDCYVTRTRMQQVSKSASRLAIRLCRAPEEP